VIVAHYLSFRVVQCVIIVVMAVFLCVACLGSSSVPEDHYYLLPEKKVNVSRLEHPTVDSVAVAPIVGQGLYRERSLLFIDAKEPLELKQYHYRHWVKAPMYLLQSDIVTLFRQVNYAKDVSYYDIKDASDVIVKGRLLNFEQIIESTESTVNVAIEFEVTTNVPIADKKWRKVYEIREKAEGQSIHKIVEAYGRALSKIYSIFLSDLEAR